jgi:hypothetical protein
MPYQEKSGNPEFSQRRFGKRGQKETKSTTCQPNHDPEASQGSGVNVMITIFGDFCQFSAKKLALSQKPML